MSVEAVQEDDLNIKGLRETLRKRWRGFANMPLFPGKVQPTAWDVTSR